MMKSCYMLIPAIYFLGHFSVSQVSFQKTYGGAGNDYADRIIRTPDGGFILAGHSDGFSDGMDIYAVRTDSLGDTLWTRFYSALGDEYCGGIQNTADGGFVIAGYTSAPGSYDSDFLLIKTDSAGYVQWTRIVGRPLNDHCSAVRQTRDGGYVLVGYTKKSAYYDAFLVRTDFSGDTLWTRMYGSLYNDWFGDIRQTPDGGYIVCGYTTTAASHDLDVYLVKTDSAGILQWSRSYGGTKDDLGRSVLLTGDGGYVLFGYTRSYGAGGIDYYLIKTDSNGDTLWTKTYGGVNDDIGVSMAKTSDGGYVLGGYTWSFGSGMNDLYITKITTNGTVQWSGVYGGIRDEYGGSVLQADDGGYGIAGYSKSYNPGFGHYDFLFVKTNSGGGVISVKSVNRHPAQPFILLFQNFPNPFNPETAIDYRISESSDVQLIIYNVLGNKVRRLYSGMQTAGHYRMVWDGRDSRGNNVSGGIYFCRLTAGNQSATKKMTLLR